MCDKVDDKVIGKESDKGCDKDWRREGQCWTDGQSGPPSLGASAFAWLRRDKDGAVQAGGIRGLEPSHRPKA